MIMEIVNRHEHERCRYFDKPDKAGKPVIELVRIAKEDEGDWRVSSNEIVFFMEGRVRFVSGNLPFEGMKGQMLFLPAGRRYSFRALQPAEVIIFRVLVPARLCDNFSLEKLYATERKVKGNRKRATRDYSVLEINARVSHLLDRVRDSLSDGIKCRGYFDLKIKEFFLLLRVYYSREEIHDFFYLVLSKDTIFSEQVRLHCHECRSVEEMALAMHLTPRQFMSRFKSVFGQTPYKWVKEERANIVRQQLLSTRKLVKQIAFENGFNNVSQLTRFCKTEIGNTPTGIRATNHTDGQ